MELKKQGSNVNVTWICPYAIHTGMFAGFESRQAWIVDVLQPEYVVKEIVHAIQTNANMVLLPKILNVVFILQAILPRKASYLLGKWAGIHDCMNNVSKKIFQPNIKHKFELILNNLRIDCQHRD